MMISKNSSSVFEETLIVQHQQESPYRFTLELGIFVALVFGALIALINNLNYNTLFLDEAINTVIGGEFLQGIDNRNAMSFHFGSYLYPTVSAIIDGVGGITALRLTSAVMMCLTAVFIYFTTRPLFGRKASLFSIMLFLFSGIILNLGQLAVYDSLALPFLSASFFFLVTAASSELRQRRLLFAAAVCAILATLSKYVGLIYLPALFVTALLLFWLKGLPLRQALVRMFEGFIWPIVQVLILYAAFFRRELVQVFQEQGFSLAPRWLVLKMIGEEIGLISVLAATGLILLFWAMVRNRHHNSQLPFWVGPSRLNWYVLPTASRVLLYMLVVLLFCTWLAAPLQQLLTANVRSLWKNCAYSLIFLSPLAGYCVATIVGAIRSRALAINVTGMVFLCGCVLYFANQALDSNWSFHQSWPNTDGAVNYLRENGLNNNSRVLAEEMDVYQYYFASEIDNHQVWNNFWYMEYKDVSGQEGALAAIRNRALDFVIINDYYFPGIRERANPILSEAGYVVGWQEVQKLRTGETILLQVFVPGDSGFQ